MEAVQSAEVPTPQTASVLTIDNLSKTFPGTRALSDAHLEIGAGEVHALVGQNGSGKSTLIKVLAGFHKADPGADARVSGEPFDIGHEVPDSLRFVHQDLGLVLELNTMDNLALRGGYTRGAGRRIKWREQERATRQVLGRFGIELDIHRPLSEASPVERTVVAIAGAMQGWSGGEGVLVLDEPTAVLPHDEVEHLLAMVREVRRAGTSVLYVSHRMDEIFGLADNVTVLRGGNVVATVPVSDVDHRELAKLMVGEDVDPDFRVSVVAETDPPAALELRDVRGHHLRGLDLDVARGEIVGIAGLAGDGLFELPAAIAGFSSRQVQGRIRLPQRSLDWHELSEASRLGIPLVPADRVRDAIIPDFAVAENLTLSSLERYGSPRKLRHAKEREVVERWTERLGIVTSSPAALISTLSGGNQQKVVIARCLAREPDILILSEPTAGVDIGTRVAIYELMAKLAEEGLSIVVASSDLSDLIAMCTRVVVLRDGRIGAELDAEDLTETQLIHEIEADRIGERDEQLN
jgi:ribose transport system ATP-binding protein